MTTTPYNPANDHLTLACAGTGRTMFLGPRHIGFVLPAGIPMNSQYPGAYKECSGTWTQYPDSERPCKCSCHNMSLPPMGYGPMCEESHTLVISEDGSSELLRDIENCCTDRIV
ncbi:hypothetical protein LCGC14_0430210 [marine sediment metagenome]|uniref:Uncharacterized protein n=1 Tax=marine sediment metagenome TaxID=412755 RepID=A0A0F9SNI2_9ZZZZ